MLKYLLLKTRKFLKYKQLIKYTHQWIKPRGHETDIKIYNYMTNSLVPLILNNLNYVTWYTCGPTVYAASHIGHAFCYVKLDLIQKLLKNYFKLNLVSAMNITNIDDKIIRASQMQNKTPNEIAEYFEKDFWNDMKDLDVSKPNIICRVTDYMPIIISFINTLIKSNNAYIVENGSVYFRLNNFKNYEKFRQINPNSEISKELFKENPLDFALWKSHKQGEPFWSGEWGTKGRPGWHIECSAIASMIFGKSIDFHCGGIDLRFPHHQNEEAQSCCYYHQDQWVNYWLHSGHLILDQEKMSKSLGNTISIKNLLKNYTKAEFRMACCLSHYRNSLVFSKDHMELARSKLEKFIRFIKFSEHFIEKQLFLKTKINDHQLNEKYNKCIKNIDHYYKNDFDIPNAMNELDDLIDYTMKNVLTSENLIEVNNDPCPNNLDVVLAVRNLIENNLEMFGLIKTDRIDSEEIELIDILVGFRNHVRLVAIKNKDNELFKLCDSLRDNLNKNYGIEVQDNKDRTSLWIKLKS